MTFQRTAQKIIDDSIRSALYVDNKIAIPFKDSIRNPSYKLCSEVFKSFDKNNTNIKFYQYRGEKKWNKEGANLLKSRDLLILDWKLQDEHPQFLNSLQILKQAVKIESIFCVVIYTDSVEKELADINHNICCFFSNIALDISHIEHQIIDKLDELGIEPNAINLRERDFHSCL